MEKVTLKLVGSRKVKIPLILNSNNIDTTHHLLYTDSEELGPISEVDYETKRLKITSIDINLMSHIDKK